MRVAVVGATGRIGRLTVEALGRRSSAARGTSIRLVPTWSGIVGLDMTGDVLLPGPDARIAPTTFDDWLAAETQS